MLEYFGFYETKPVERPRDPKEVTEAGARSSSLERPITRRIKPRSLVAHESGGNLTV